MSLEYCLLCVESMVSDSLRRILSKYFASELAAVVYNLFYRAVKESPNITDEKLQIFNKNENNI